MELWIGALVLGLIYSLMTIGVYITYKILDFADITVDGSFTLGAAVSAILITSGMDPFFSLFFATLAGAAAGAVTGLIHTKMKVNGLLAGILVMIALYSINLHIMGRSNVPLLSLPSFMNFFLDFNPGMPTEIWLSIVLMVIISGVCWLSGLFFKTDLGLTLRATGDNSIMSSALGVNVDAIKIFGIALSNGLVGLAGAAIAQYQGFADIGMGIGMVVNGLAAVIIGEAILKIPSIYAKISSAAIGSIIFRFMIAFALFAGMNPIDLKLLTALFVLLTLFISLVVNQKGRRGKFSINSQKLKKYSLAIGLIAVVAIAGTLLYNAFEGNGDSPISGKKKIGVVQITSNGILDITREALLKELSKLGYDEDNLEIVQKNANGDISTLNSIIDNFTVEKVDIIVAISTPALQAAISKVKDVPIVFATIANPFILKAGTSETDHLPNVTGTYGWAPMDKTLEFVTDVLGTKIKIGTVWDIGQANSEFNIHNLKEELKKYPNIEYYEATVNNSSEVQQAAVSLVNKNIDAFVLAPDNTVYSAFDAILKISNEKKIPIFIGDVERLKDGALGALGYDYETSGIDAARIVDRILKGEKPADIPFQKYTKLVYGLNNEAAKLLGIKFSSETIYKANKFIGLKKVDKKKKIGIVQFAMEPNVEICKEGILHALEGYGYKDGENIEILYKNANADFPMINSIMQDLIARDVDIIVPLSTPVVQAAVQQVGTRKKPNVVFTYIYDPYKIGAAKSPTDHLPNFTGVACFPPMQDMFDLIKEMYPDKKKVGIVWNSSEANSESVVKLIRSFVGSKGFELVESTVTNPSEVLDASKSLINKGAEIFLNAGDNTLNVAYDSYAKVAADAKIPLFSVDAELIYNNTIATLGPDYYRTGFDGGVYLARILDGENTAKIPIMQTKETLLYINQDVAKKLNYTFSDSLLNKASRIVVDSTLKTLKEIQEAKQKSISKNDKNQKKLAVFLFNDNSALLDIYDGYKKQMNDWNIYNQYNIKEDYMNAQSDWANAQLISKDILQKKYDYVVSFSTPALQSLAGVNSVIPHIFGGVTDPYSLGIAKSPTDHRPNISGVATFQPVESTIKLIRQVFPKAKKIGIVWNPSEACSFACTGKAREACKQYGFELVEANVTSTSETGDALNSVLEKGIDVFLTSGDNTVILSIPTIAKKLQELKIPYFTNAYSDVDKGVFMSLGADYYQVGIEAAKMIKKVIEGEDIAKLPIRDFVPERMNINLDLVKKYKIKIPDDVMKKYKTDNGGGK